MTPTAVGAIASYVEREGVSSVRIISIESMGYGRGAVALCGAGDGSRFYVTTDEWGNHFGWADTIEESIEKLNAAAGRTVNSAFAVA